MVFAWAGMWSLLSRVVIGRFHYAEHFALAGGAILVALLFSISAEWLEFLRPSLPALWVASVFGSGALLAALVFGHLGWASSMLRRSRLWAALGVSAVVIGTGAIADYAARNTFKPRWSIPGSSKPSTLAGCRLSPSINSSRIAKKSKENLKHWRKRPSRRSRKNNVVI